MAKIKITCENSSIIETEGRLTFETFKDYETGGITTRGQLAIHEYIEDIHEIETARFVLPGVDVFREVFGSNDFNILYEFELGEGFDVIVKKDILTEDKIQAIKEKEYKDDESKLWDGEEAWK